MRPRGPTGRTALAAGLVVLVACGGEPAVVVRAAAADPLATAGEILRSIRFAPPAAP